MMGLAGIFAFGIVGCRVLFEGNSRDGHCQSFEQSGLLTDPFSLLQMKLLIRMQMHARLPISLLPVIS